MSIDPIPHGLIGGLASMNDRFDFIRLEDYPEKYRLLRAENDELRKFLKMALQANKDAKMLDAILARYFPATPEEGP